MRNIVAVSLPGNILKKLEKEAKQEGASRSEIIKRSLSRYFFTHDLSRARNKALAELGARGVVLTDEDIFKAVS
ncbi:MAG: ribbon-helix-helix protein, CopG family [Candidatus Omnitrophica bacterium]|nr:ribbon-helix-helix protein, CopG family [Candidatus Omnitrophota bacterium]MDE2010502.1 ribbon-helix-helix protein, CopG family [Candidatus Omnitrophota bacterium]MDE2215521.1 ribbon-helix-helix protein, CopG family [Candidatus Omnitrophota bacterium]MDE2232366.1 ribbon-helix-helix protein, CopG family [Candidatus Omnitrophota bacterium]